VNEKTEADVEQFKEEGQEVPEDWYKNQWIRCFADQEGDQPLKTIESEAG
jgi:hypothetical protein